MTERTSYVLVLLTSSVWIVCMGYFYKPVLPAWAVIGFGLCVVVAWLLGKAVRR